MIKSRSLMFVLAAAFLAAGGCRQAVRVTGQQVRHEVAPPPYLSWPGEPVFEKVPGTGITWMKEYNGKPVGADYDICMTGGRWYWPYKGTWFTARREWRGPWKPARAVPDDFLRIPKSHPLRRVVKLHPRNLKPAATGPESDSPVTGG